MKHICILGATGSIGIQTLDVIRKEKYKFKLIGVTANSNFEKLIAIIEEFSPRMAAVVEKEAYLFVKDYCKANNIKTEVLYGMDGLNAISTMEEADIIVTSIVGMVGLVPTLNAIEAGKDIALANKETLVVGGELVMAAAAKKNIKILPVDSEHGAIFQCLQGNSIDNVSKIILTASGGPFRGKTKDELSLVSVGDALKHPKWNMGKKISIDSATLMNKGLEVIEAHWLFKMEYDNIQVVVHPQSIIHSMVEYKDGSVIAQLGSTDMRLPIQYALCYPEREASVVEKLDFYNMANLTFERPDYDTFKCLTLAYEAGKKGGIMPTILNGANEEAVNLLLNNEIKFMQIGDIIEDCMCRFGENNKATIHTILEMDYKVKEYIRKKYKA
jgi:1-deoxy-D-xylulose-5-phosphate reductoisomerase